MHIDPAELPARDVYHHLVRLVTPRPIAWVTTISAGGVVNLAPYSFFNAVGANPPTVMFCPVNRRDGSQKDTLRNIEANGEFVVNVVSHDMADVMNQTSADYECEVSELAAVGLTAAPSSKVTPPRVAEAKAQLECTLLQTLHLGSGPIGANMVIGRIVMLHLRDDILDAEGQVDPHQLDTIGRMGGASYTRTTERFDLPRPQLPST